ncbi:hypothetical protein BSKO_00239 [Bryopsis sp. KO-2023]|nr:hypothetical protein BSKO_00239 [Bryopsis sp. KO-2023]
MTVAKGLFHNVALAFAVSVWVGSIVICASLLITAAVLLVIAPMYGAIFSAFVLFLRQSPIDFMPQWAKRFIQFATDAGMEYFSIKIVTEDEDSIKPGRPYLVGYEPHSIIPVGLPIVFNDLSKALPKGLKGCHGVASSICFRAPVIRHLWWWLGLRPVSKESITNMLSSGKSCVLIPGGVREVLSMEKGKEVIFLSKRFGFVKMAMQQGVPIVPVFAFGQSKTYAWWKLSQAFPASWIRNLARRSGVEPMLLWGRWGTVVPYKVPITIAIGEAIEVPHEQNPEDKKVEEILSVFIKSMRALYEKHKEAAGYGDIELEIL